jgi:predicted transcriptional regulator of viral defense system
MDTFYTNSAYHTQMAPSVTSKGFFSTRPVFRREEYARALGKSVRDPNVDSMLKQHLRAGNVRRVSRGVYASVPPHADASSWVVDQFLAASRLRTDAVVAYHSALELHGYAYTTYSEVQLVSSGPPARLEAAGFTCRFLATPRGWDRPADVVAMDRLGLDVSVTTLERTVTDLFDRYDLAGGAEELLQSLTMIPRLKVDRLYACMRSLGNASAAAAAGWWLSTQMERLDVTPSDLVRFRGLAPNNPQYALGAKPGAAKWLPDWSVMLPTEILGASFEGL